MRVIDWIILFWLSVITVILCSCGGSEPIREQRIQHYREMLKEKDSIRQEQRKREDEEKSNPDLKWVLQ